MRNFRPTVINCSRRREICNCYSNAARAGSQDALIVKARLENPAFRKGAMVKSRQDRFAIRARQIAEFLFTVAISVQSRPVWYPPVFESQFRQAPGSTSRSI